MKTKSPRLSRPDPIVAVIKNGAMARAWKSGTDPNRVFGTPWCDAQLRYSWRHYGGSPSWGKKVQLTDWAVPEMFRPACVWVKQVNGVELYSIKLKHRKFKNLDPRWAAIYGRAIAERGPCLVGAMLVETANENVLGGVVFSPTGLRLVHWSLTLLHPPAWHPYARKSHARAAEAIFNWPFTSDAAVATLPD